MWKYIIKRILLSILILLCVTFVIYTLLRCLPSSFVESMAVTLSQALERRATKNGLRSSTLPMDWILGLFPDISAG